MENTAVTLRDKQPVQRWSRPLLWTFVAAAMASNSISFVSPIVGYIDKSNTRVSIGTLIQLTGLVVGALMTLRTTRFDDPKVLRVSLWTVLAGQTFVGAWVVFGTNFLSVEVDDSYSAAIAKICIGGASFFVCVGYASAILAAGRELLSGPVPEFFKLASLAVMAKAFGLALFAIMSSGWLRGKLLSWAGLSSGDFWFVRTTVARVALFFPVLVSLAVVIYATRSIRNWRIQLADDTTTEDATSVMNNEVGTLASVSPTRAMWTVGVAAISAVASRTSTMRSAWGGNRGIDNYVSTWQWVTVIESSVILIVVLAVIRFGASEGFVRKARGLFVGGIALGAMYCFVTWFWVIDWRISSALHGAVLAVQGVTLFMFIRRFVAPKSYGLALSLGIIVPAVLAFDSLLLRLITADVNVYLIASVIAVAIVALSLRTRRGDQPQLTPVSSPR
jgi:hypothetical protein